MWMVMTVIGKRRVFSLVLDEMNLKRRFIFLQEESHGVGRRRRPRAGGGSSEQ